MTDTFRVYVKKQSFDFNPEQIILSVNDTCFAIYEKKSNGFPGKLLHLFRSFPDEMYLGPKAGLDIYSIYKVHYQHNKTPDLQSYPFEVSPGCLRKLQGYHLYDEAIIKAKIFQGRLHHYWPN